MDKNKKFKIAAIHLDMGIGGAEQLIVNLGLALINKGHSFKIFTPHHGKDHCFPETIDGTLEVEVRGGIFPKTIFGRFVAFCSNIRMILATLHLCLFGEKFDIVVVDQVSLCVPILKLFRNKVLFYCHFPDKLICVERSTFIKRFYRFFLDFAEEVCLIPSDLIVSNSEFTRQVFKKNFKILNYLKIDPEVYYPAIDLKKFDIARQKLEQNKSQQFNYQRFFVSINRYERKKKVQLTIEAYAELLKLNSKTDVKLIIAGGYDNRVLENIEYLEELKQLAKKLGVEDKVTFRCSISDEEKAYLLINAIAVLYTPENEHFGIVPIEAMYNATPVICCNSGGPLESVKHGECGYLLEQKPDVWAIHMNILANDSKKVQEMGQVGKKHTQEKFGLETFSNKADEYAKYVYYKKQLKKAQ